MAAQVWKHTGGIQVIQDLIRSNETDLIYLGYHVPYIKNKDTESELMQVKALGVTWNRFSECEVHKDFIHSLTCAECDDSLPFSGASSIPLCYVLFLAWGCIFKTVQDNQAIVLWITGLGIDRKVKDEEEKLLQGIFIIWIVGVTLWDDRREKLLCRCNFRHWAKMV